MEQSQKPNIVINTISFGDLRKALRLGVRDFVSYPLYGLFFAGIYTSGGLLLVGIFLFLNIQWPIYPLAIGFALIGPYIASGLYEISRRAENNLAISWSVILSVIWDQKNRELGWMAFVMLFVFWVWMYQARTLFVVFFGFGGFATIEGFLSAIFTTSNGMYFLIIGNLIGAVISFIMFSVTVISCPMLLDRDIDFVTAMITSIRTIVKSPLPLILWAGIVISSVLLSMIPAFLGLFVTLPIFGHSTWHLYRSSVSYE
jgi:uncharacterized membrane protein